MNENLNLVEILKDCPKGTELYSTVFGKVRLGEINVNSYHPICILCERGDDSLAEDGRLFCDYDGECTLFPSREQRDWSKFKPKQPKQPKQPKFDPKTLQPFDKVLGRDKNDENNDWRCNFFSHITNHKFFPYATTGGTYTYCIPYNEDTKHLVGTSEDAPEFYRYWED